MDSAEIAAQLRAAIDEGLQLFAALDETRTAVRPDTGGWCPREVVGHLIDSACNNHRRFVIGQWSADLVLDGYQQDEWVKVQCYGDAPWADLVRLWSAYNRHLAHVIAHAPDDAVSREKSPHSFASLRPLDQPLSLAVIMEDYVRHLRHHLAQVRKVMA